MKAFLLAAGYGTRLKPLTDNTPKCLIPINGKPLLGIWLDLLEREGIDEVLINTHYLHKKVENFIEKRNNRIKIKLSYEKTLLGSGGTIIKNKDFVAVEENFYVLYADNLTNVALGDLLKFHLSKKSIFTTYVYETDIPREKGIFVADKSGKVLEFQEKPEHPKSNLANAGIGILNNEIFGYFNKDKFIDFGKDIMDKIIHNMYVLYTDLFIKDIGSIEDYISAQKEWKLIN